MLVCRLRGQLVFCCGVGRVGRLVWFQVGWLFDCVVVWPAVKHCWFGWLAGWLVSWEPKVVGYLMRWSSASFMFARFLGARVAGWLGWLAGRSWLSSWLDGGVQACW